MSEPLYNWMLSHTSDKRNHLCCSGGQSCCRPGWTSEQNSTVKHLNSCFWPLRTQFNPSKYLYSPFLCGWFLYQVAVDSGPFQCRVSICGLSITENQPVPIGVLFFKWSIFVFLPLWNTCFQKRQRIYGGCQGTKWMFSITASSS